MLRYLVRRVLGSIPVLLVASFLTFWLVRAIDRPAREVPAHQGLRSSVLAEQRKRSGSTTRSSCSGGTGSRTFVRGDLGTSSRTQRPGVGDDRARAVADAAADVLGDDRLGGRSRSRSASYSAVKQYSVGDYVVHRALVRRHRDARLLVRAARDRVARDAARRSWFHLDHPIFYSVGLHNDGRDGLQPRLLPTPRAARCSR